MEHDIPFYFVLSIRSVTVHYGTNSLPPVPSGESNPLKTQLDTHNVIHFHFCIYIYVHTHRYVVSS